MAKKKASGVTEIIIVLDRSGSMGGIRLDTIEGFNKFLEDQRKLGINGRMTLAQFDDNYQLDYEGVDINDVKYLDEYTYEPRGMTALFDAVGKTINDTKKRLKTNPVDNVVFVVITDGHENASQEFNQESAFKMITECKDDNGWEFVFLGANQDAIQSGGHIGVRAATSATFDTSNIRAAYDSLSSNVRSYRSTGVSGSLDWSQAQRKSLVE